MPKSFDPAKDIPDLSGRVILVTGGNAGLGAATVEALAPHKPECIYLCARNVSTAEALVQKIHQTSPNANIKILALDLASLDSVKKCASEFNDQASRLDILFLNAGISMQEPSLTQEGYEVTFGVNHLGHALLTQLLLPKMLETKNSDPKADLRIVLTSSIGAFMFGPKGGLLLSEMKEPAGPHFKSAPVRYGHSKLANLLFAKKLAQLYPGITSTSVHPGTVKSEIWGRAKAAKIMMYALSPIVWLTGVTTEVGAWCQLWAATAPVQKGQVESGMYYEPVGVLKAGSKEAQSQDLTDELWEWTERELAVHGGPGWPKA
ncbi:NAD(P)-binding protein [Teratosphaeria nubilosa]|uniref:NAD(P)-binding protein n=1 Tax=Teratosphaeria nubilosa TaxID=161662 RepID=A0A6G1L871_9PEZI|nr:NAD(P)-binding protein [Teratosphaeria nubilosa]